ncbi:MAG: transketolase C-terminal domain-containing protein, partial [Nitrospinota bacterium]
QGTSGAHGSPLGEEEVKLAKKALGWDPGRTFYIPEEVRRHFRQALERGRRTQEAWQVQFRAYAEAYPELAEEWKRRMAGELPGGWDVDLPAFQPGEKLATREAAGKVLNAIAARVPELIGGDADLSSSTKTTLKGGGSFDGRSGAGRNIHFGVREHAMGGIANGMAHHGGVRPFTATFFCFSDYMRPSVRLAALSKLPVIFVWTHDSIGLGEDGPTHQPVEHLMCLRAMPSLHVLRPCDAAEAVAAWRWAMTHRDGPVALVLTRQRLPVLDRSRGGNAFELERGAYVLSEAEGGPPHAVLIATGSEVHVALEAQELLAGEGIRARVVSMPCWELFEAQSEDYQESVLPKAVKARVSVEAGSRFGWSRWIGDHGLAVGLDRFGASAPAAVNMEKFGITGQAVAKATRKLVREADS